MIKPLSFKLRPVLIFVVFFGIVLLTLFASLFKARTIKDGIDTQSIAKITQSPININSEVNPTYISGILRMADLNRIINSKVASPNQFISKNKKVRFNHPKEVYVIEYGGLSKDENNVNLFISANIEDRRIIDEFNRCVKSTSESYDCDVPDGEYLLVSLTYNSSTPDVSPKGLEVSVPGPLRNSYLSGTAAYLYSQLGNQLEDGSIDMYGNARVAVESSATDKIRYHYTIVNKGMLINISTQATPYNWPYKLVISEMLNSLLDYPEHLYSYDYVSEEERN